MGFRLTLKQAHMLNIDPALLDPADLRPIVPPEMLAKAKVSGGMREAFESKSMATEEVKAKSKHRSHTTNTKGPNRTEQRFADGLEFMKTDIKSIRDYDFTPEKFRMADRTFYHPDFRVTLHSGLNIFIEVKVAKDNGEILWTDDGAVKCKTLPELHPIVLYLAVYHGKSGWVIERLPSRNWGWIEAPITWRI